MKKMALTALIISFSALITTPARAMEANLPEVVDYGDTDDSGDDWDDLDLAIRMSVEASAGHNAGNVVMADDDGSSSGAPQDDELPAVEPQQAPQQREDIDELMATILEIEGCPDGMIDQIVTKLFIDRGEPLPRGTVANLQKYLPLLLRCSEVAAALYYSPDRQLFIRILNLVISEKIQQPEKLLPFIYKFNNTYHFAKKQNSSQQLLQSFHAAIHGNEAVCQRYFDLPEGIIYANARTNDEKVRVEIRLEGDYL